MKNLIKLFKTNTSKPSSTNISTPKKKTGPNLLTNKKKGGQFGHTGSDLRIFKTKTKISGGFRSMKAAECFVNALSIIKNSIKRDLNPFEAIKMIFNNEVLFA